MDQIQYNKETVQKWWTKGVISPEFVPEITLNDIIQRMEKEEFKVWSKLTFNPTTEPAGINAGVSICFDCGKMYWVTPIEDAYKIPHSELEGRVCDPCIVRLATERDKIDYDYTG